MAPGRGLIRGLNGNHYGMGSILAAVSHADLSTLFIVLALLCFALAAYVAYLGNFIGALVLVFIAVVILVV